VHQKNVAGSRGRDLSQRVSEEKPPLKTKTLLAFGRSIEAANGSVFLICGNEKNLIYFCFLAQMTVNKSDFGTLLPSKFFLGKGNRGGARIRAQGDSCPLCFLLWRPHMYTAPQHRRFCQPNNPEDPRK